jgi:hypothetical protein
LFSLVVAGESECLCFAVELDGQCSLYIYLSLSSIVSLHVDIVRYAVWAEFVSLWCKEINPDLCVLLSDAMMKDVIEFAWRLVHK